MSQKLLIVSTSTIHGSKYLEYIQDEMANFFGKIKEVVFVPYARPSGISHDEYTAMARAKFEDIGYKLTGVHEVDDPVRAIMNAEGIFIGGGNTFVLLEQLYLQKLFQPLRMALNTGTPYMGTSAGGNITGQTIGTTNDMPIVHPPSLEALKLIPFNINPHYLDPDPDSKHKGETRETRIKEFHQFNNQPVVGLREGSWLRLEDGKLILKGEHSARFFFRDKAPYEQEPGEVTHLLMR